jgi:outer membrane protein assembly factor BamE
MRLINQQTDFPLQGPARSSNAPRLLSMLCAMALLGLAGCLYRMPIVQGNFLDKGQVAQLETGMTRSQVSFLLGTPMVPNGFNSDRWDYYYYVNARQMRKPYSERLTVWFKDDKVERIEKSDTGTAVVPNAAPPEATPAAVAPEASPAAAPAAAAPPATVSDSP